MNNQVGQKADNYSFFSAHPHGVQFAMADSSVHFVNNTIGTNVYWAMATARGAEVATLPNN